jgi:hypothetical protein
MVLDLATEFVFQFVQTNSLFLVIAFIIFIFIAYKVFRAIMKAIFVAFVAGLFPLAVFFFGMYEPESIWGMIQTMMWFALAGVALFFVYSAMSTVAKIVKIILSPLGLIFRGKKEKVIIRERVVEKDDKEKEKK